LCSLKAECRSRRLSSVVHSCAAAVKCCIVSCCIACCLFGACCIVYRVRGTVARCIACCVGLRAEAAPQRPHGRGYTVGCCCSRWARPGTARHGPARPGLGWCVHRRPRCCARHGTAPHRTAPHRTVCALTPSLLCTVGRTRTSRAMPASRRCTTLCVHRRPLVLSSLVLTAACDGLLAAPC
jgi:hypothetical protein